MACFRLALALAVGSFIIATPANAQVGGGIFLDVQDGFSHRCIDVTKHDISMMLVTLQAKRTNKFWKTSKMLGAKLDVIILNRDGKEFTFPRGTLLSAKDIIGDIALLPIRAPIMSKYSLVGEGNKPYVNVSLDFYVINLEKQSDAVNGIFQFIEFSKSLPLPPNPYITGVQLFGDFAQKIVVENIRSAEEKEPAAKFSFDLPSSDRDVESCPSTALRNGLNAVMFSFYGDPQPGIIALEDYNKYCYYLESSSSRIVYRPKRDNVCDSNTAPTILRNPLVAFIVASYSKDPTAVAALLPPRTVEPPPPSVPSQTITDVAADLWASKAARHHALAMDEIKADNVKLVFDALNAPRVSTEVIRSTIENLPSANPAARVREVEAAIALQLCSLAGIPAADCQL